MRRQTTLPPLRLGCHLSIAQGFAAAVQRAENLGNTALQVFTHSPTTWRMRPLSTEEVAGFQRALRASAVSWTAVHTAYLINLASPDHALRRRSTVALIEEIDRAAALGVDAVVTHVGHAMGASPSTAMRRVADSLAHVLASPAFGGRSELHLALENTSGAGTSVGGTFEEFGELLERLGSPERVGLCLDTCHAIAAGIDLRSMEGVNQAVDQVDDAVGPGRITLIHLNDSQHPVGSKKDRHAHIGQGVMGEEGVAAVLAHPALRRVPVILETPKQFDDGADADPVNLSKVRALRDRATAPSS